MVPATAVRAERRWLVPHATSAVPGAREELVEWLTSVGATAETAGEAELTVSELLGNAITHASPGPRGCIGLRAQVREDVVEVAVTDGGSAEGGASDIRPRRSSIAATRGRGLRIVRSLAHEWGVVVNDDGRQTTVWAAIGGPSRRRAG